MPPGRSPTRPCQASWPDLGRPAWTRPANLAPPQMTLHVSHSFGDSPMDPQTLGAKPKVKVRPKGLICPSNGLPKWQFDVGMIIQGWTYTCIQENTMRINANHWMEVNTSGGMDELVTWIKGPTFRMNNGQPTPNRRGRATPHRPSHNGS